MLGLGVAVKRQTYEEDLLHFGQKILKLCQNAKKVKNGNQLGWQLNWYKILNK